MYVLLLIAVLLRATNALECWQGFTEITTPGGTKRVMELAKCPAALAFTHCSTISCSMDEKALKGLPGILPGNLKSKYARKKLE
uniref:Secreted protein n=1 Tax=Globodera pallida TaxID=36090 RepID=A0A183CQE0_GLOPA